MGPDALILIAILITSVVLHEVAHGYAAYKLGDPTAKLQGRLTLNPFMHLDPVGSVIVPGILALGSTVAVGAPSFIFGWAKPVPYNPYNFNDQKYGEAKVALAGPAINLMIAVIFGVLIQLRSILGLPPTFIDVAFQVIFINILLMVFNLLPIPPLDGSKILPAFLSFNLRMKYQNFRNILEQNVFLAFSLLFFIVFVFLREPLAFVVTYISYFLAGL